MVHEASNRNLSGTQQSNAVWFLTNFQRIRGSRNGTVMGRYLTPVRSIGYFPVCIIYKTGLRHIRITEESRLRNHTSRVIYKLTSCKHAIQKADHSVGWLFISAQRRQKNVLVSDFDGKLIAKSSIDWLGMQSNRSFVADKFYVVEAASCSWNLFLPCFLMSSLLLIMLLKKKLNNHRII